MKIVKINSAYSFYLDSFHKKNNLTNLSYQQIKKKLDDDFFSWPNSLSRAMKLQQVDLVEYLSNFHPMQTTWAKENNVKFDNENWMKEIIEAQISSEKPDVLFMDDYINFDEHWISQIRKKCPTLKLVLGWCGAPFKNFNVFRSYDFVLSCIPELVETFISNGIKAYHVDHAFDPLVLEKLKNDSVTKYDFSFIGQLVRGQNYHLEREHLLEALMQEVPLTIFSPSYDIRLNLNDYVLTSAKQGFYLIAKALPFPLFKAFKKLGKVYEWKQIPKLPVNSKLQKLMQPGVFGLDMFQTLKMSKIVLNSHIDISPRSASNMRLFEATGVGSCLLTDWKENLNDLFQDEREVVSYKNELECVNKVKYLLNNDQKRLEIALNGQKRTLKDHTFNERAIVIKKVIEANI